MIITKLSVTFLWTLMFFMTIRNGTVCKIVGHKKKVDTRCGSYCD